MMRQRRAMLIAAVVLCSGFLSVASATAGPSAPAASGAALSGNWGTAEEVPGSGTLNTNGHADIVSVSCVSAGNCSAGGFYSSGIAPNGKTNSQALSQRGRGRPTIDMTRPTGMRPNEASVITR